MDTLKGEGNSDKLTASFIIRYVSSTSSYKGVTFKILWKRNIKDFQMASIRNGKSI